MKGVFLIMRIYQPVRGVGGALRENSFVIIDDAGVEIGQGGLEYRVIKKMLPDRPLDIEMTMSAHPVADAAARALVISFIPFPFPIVS